MGFSNFRKIRQVTKKFGLDAELVERVDDILPVQPSAWLVETLMIAEEMPLTNEKSKSERIVSPILIEVARKYKGQITMFSGEELSVAPQDDLSGECDFFFGLHAAKPYLEAPIMTLVEAKDEDLEWGVAQCAAQIYAAYLYNKNEEKEISVLYGCATTGDDWQFIRFENGIFYIDSRPTTNLPTVLGSFHKIFDYYTKKSI